MIVDILRKTVSEYLLLNFQEIRKLLQESKSISEVVYFGLDLEKDWVQVELLPIQEIVENNIKLIDVRMHVRDGHDDICCSLYFLENGNSYADEYIYKCDTLGLPEKSEKL
ncbi:MAG: hypothetical protein Q7U57_01135 [Methylovulum sp.]|nr:hypothetical protein [Methylovulum sp.]